MAIEYTEATDYSAKSATAIAATAEEATPIAATAQETTALQNTDECTWKQLNYEGEGQGYADDIDAEFDDIYIVDGPSPG